MCKMSGHFEVSAILTKQTNKQTKRKERVKEMKMMIGEVVLNIPAEKAWEIYRNNEIIGKINPEMLSATGDPGSLRLFKLAVCNYVKESMEKIEKVEMGRSVTYQVIGGDLKELYHPYRVTFSFIPMEGEENEKCIAEWKAEFEALAPATPPPEKARGAPLEFL